MYRITILKVVLDRFPSIKVELSELAGSNTYLDEQYQKGEAYHFFFLPQHIDQFRSILAELSNDYLEEKVA